MTKTSTQTLTPAQKRQLHSHLNRLILFAVLSPQNKKDFTSRIYQLWAAVLNRQDQSLDVSGIINAFDGNHHISKLQAKYGPQFIEFIRYITDQNEGNLNKLANSLVIWFGPLSKIIKQLSQNQNKLKEAIEKHIEQDLLVLQIRGLLQI